MGRPVVAAISFLNTAPLVWDFQHGTLGREFDVRYAVPSACAEALRTAAADIAIVPAITYHSIPGLQIVPDVCVGTSGAVRSILLISKVPIEDVRTVAADTASRSSVALLRVIFRTWLGGPRQFTAMEPYLPLMLEQHDAALIIGDPAFAVDRARYITYDLGEEWVKRTGKPFVFAFWAVREAAVEKLPAAMDLVRVLRDSRDHGLDHVEQLSSSWSKRLPLTRNEVRDYLTRNLDYRLDAAHLDGMELFLELAVQHGVLPARQPLRFLEDVRSAPLRRANGSS